MLAQVFLGLDVALRVQQVVRHLFAVDLDVAPALPVVEHLAEGVAADAQALTHVVRLLAGEDLGQQVEQVLRASVVDNFLSPPRNSLQDNTPRKSKLFECFVKHLFKEFYIFRHPRLAIPFTFITFAKDYKNNKNITQ